MAVFMFAVEDCNKASVHGRYLYAFSLIPPVELFRPLEASYQLMTSQNILVINSVLLTTVQGRQAVEGNKMICGGLSRNMLFRQRRNFLCGAK